MVEPENAPCRKEGLSNVRCAWLPKNTTSEWQPMDQGIIASFKCKYRRFWVDYMLRQIEAGKNPHKTVTLLKAIQWIRASWANVTDTTVQRCWYKSTVIKKPKEAVTDDNLAQEQAEQIELQAQVKALPDIEPLSIAEFIEPVSERINNEDGDIFESVVYQYAANLEGQESEESDGEELPKVSTIEALKYLEGVRLWQLQQEDTLNQDLQAVDRIERGMRLKKVNSMVQPSITSFFQRRD